MKTRSLSLAALSLTVACGGSEVIFHEEVILPEVAERPVDCRSPGVHESAAAGDHLAVRADGEIVELSPQPCALLGTFGRDESGLEYEVIASSALSEAADAHPTCGACLALHAEDEAPSSELASTIFLEEGEEVPVVGQQRQELGTGFTLRLSTPAVVETLGQRGQYLGHMDRWHIFRQRYSAAQLAPTISSYCHAAPESFYWGQSSHPLGYQRVSSTSYGNLRYVMEEYVYGEGWVISGAGVEPVWSWDGSRGAYGWMGKLVHPPREDVCDGR